MAAESVIALELRSRDHGDLTATPAAATSLHSYSDHKSQVGKWVDSNFKAVIKNLATLTKNYRKVKRTSFFMP